MQYADFDFSLLKNKYEVFRETGDIYALFVELGIKVLKANALLSYIVSNRFCTTNYGSSLRKYLSKFQLQNIINFNEISVFDEANVGTLIFSLKNTAKQENNVNIVEITDNKLLSKLDGHNLDFIKINQDYLGEEQWLFVPEIYYSITNKMKKKGTPLCEITDLNINRGITTGANKYFVIDNETKNNIIGGDKLSGNIIKPLLKGKDIKRFKVLDYDNWIIFTRRGIDIDKYPSILKYLLPFNEELTPGKGRKAGSYKWFEIQDNTAFYNEFEKEKLIWTRLSNTNSFAISTNKEYAIDSTAFATGKNLKYYCAILNSKAVFFFFKLGSVIWGKNGIKWFGSYFDNIPIPMPNNKILQQIEPIVEKIINLKKENLQSDTSKFEKQIDKLVYKLYGFTKDEIEIIENYYENRY